MADKSHLIIKKIVGHIVMCPRAKTTQPTGKLDRVAGSVKMLSDIVM